MSSFKEIIGQEHIISHFTNAISLEKISHAYILNGEKGTGKKTIAQVIAQAIQCEEKTGDACGHCESCVQAEGKNQPDIIWVTHQKPNSIGVEDIRTQINQDILVKPYKSQYKVYIVDEAEKMTVEAQNALLKTMEEPPHYGVIILLTTNADKFLPTILSRCMLFNMKPIEDKLIEDYLEQHFSTDPQQRSFCVQFAQGNLGKAIRLVSSEEFQAIKEDCIHLLKYMREMEVYEIIDAVKNLTKYKLQINDYIDLMMMWYRDILILKITASPNKLVFKEEYNYLSKEASKISYEGIELIMKAMEKAKVRFNANVNFDVAMELLLFTIKEN
ncbi:MAG: DNA polymerase III subunit delta' [Lachnospiraceae bacterium]|nr:DNA polymerase III subunit delta' [Lachnospiraceae bacterium]